jgi:hypothetical protein
VLNNKLATISLRQESESTEQTVREWLVKLAEIHRKNGAPYPLTAVMTAVWVDSLGDLDADVLDAAFRKLAQAGCRREFPIPADARAHIDRANANGLQLEAEEAWRAWVKHIDRHYHPDLGWDQRTRQLPAITEHAARAAGGAFWVSTCPESDMQWARKRFIESYTLAHETGQVQHLLTRGEARKILASFASEAPARQLPQPAHAPIATGPEPSKPDHETLRALDDVFEKLNAPRPGPVLLSAEELESRKQEQRERFNRHLQEHPELCGRTEVLILQSEEAGS